MQVFSVIVLFIIKILLCRDGFIYKLFLRKIKGRDMRRIISLNLGYLSLLLSK